MNTESDVKSQAKDNLQRMLAAVLVWFKVADPVNHALFGAWSDFATVDSGHIVIDGVGLVVAVGVAIRANRWYPLCFAAFQLVAFAAHVVRGAIREIHPLAYGAMYVGPSYFQMVVLALGIWAHRRRTVRRGSYPSWRNSSPFSQVSKPAIWRSD